MKRITLLSTFIFAAMIVFAQNEETRSLSSFNYISAHEGIDVYFKSGSKEEARISARNIDLRDVLTEVEGGKLKIHLDGNNHNNVDVTVWVTYKKLNGVSASSAADMRGENRIIADGDFRVSASSAGDVEVDVKANNLDISALSAGDIEIKVEANDVKCDVASAGNIEIKGTSKGLHASVSSSGDFEGFDLVCEEADVSASSGGSIEITVKEQLDARASSGGGIKYKGNPRMDVSTSGGGYLKKY